MNGNQVLDRQTVTYGSAATAPNAPTLDGYTFMDWDKAFDNVTTPLTVKAVYAVTYDLWVAGKQVNSVNCGDVLGDGKVSYDHTTGTLTLNGATVGGSVYSRFGFSDVSALLLALDAEVVLYKRGAVKLSDYQSEAWDRDIITHIRIPKGRRA